MNTQTAPTGDPLLARVALPHQGVFYPFGFPLVVASNSRLVLQAAVDSWDGWEKRFEETPLEIRCVVGGTGLPTGSPVVRAQGNLIASVADAENFWSGDLAGGFASAWVSADTAGDRSFFRYHFLEAMAYCLVDMRHMVAVHAACVGRNGRGVLLAGDSGAGKSSLAYACARRGWTYTSDDGSHVLRRSRDRRVLGNCRLFRFRESAGELFPEFRGLNGIRRANGKPTVEIRTDALPGIRTSAECSIHYIVFLDRHSGAGPELIPVPAAEARRRLFFDPWPRELPAHADRQSAVERLLTAATYELRYRDLDGAVERLEQLVWGGIR